MLRPLRIRSAPRKWPSKKEYWGHRFQALERHVPNQSWVKHAREILLKSESLGSLMAMALAAEQVSCATLKGCGSDAAMLKRRSHGTQEGEAGEAQEPGPVPAQSESRRLSVEGAAERGSVKERVGQGGVDDQTALQSSERSLPTSEAQSVEYQEGEEQQQEEEEVGMMDDDHMIGGGSSSEQALTEDELMPDSGPNGEPPQAGVACGMGKGLEEDEGLDAGLQKGAVDGTSTGRSPFVRDVKAQMEEVLEGEGRGEMRGRGEAAGRRRARTCGMPQASKPLKRPRKEPAPVACSKKVSERAPRCAGCVG